MPHAQIHPTALIDPKAELAHDVEVGAYSIIGPKARVDSGSVIGPHVVIHGTTSIGRNNRIYQFCSLGEAPQDKKYAGEETRLEIGNDNTIREFCTFNRGTVQDGGVTRIGNDNWLMAYVHIAHDCQVGDHTIFANNSSLAGHVLVQDYAILGGFTLVHQFCKIGAHVITAAGTVVFKDVPPYITVAGYQAKPHGINSEGLKRRGFTAETITSISRAYKTLYKSGMLLGEAKQSIAEQRQECPELGILLEFLETTTRGIVR